MAKRFKMKRKPVKPRRETTYHLVTSLWCDMTLAEILKSVKQKGDVLGIELTPENVYIADEYDGYELYCSVDEDDSSFNERVRQYERDLENYEAWCEKHADEIAQLEDQTAQRKLDSLLKRKTDIDAAIRAHYDKNG